MNNDVGKNFIPYEMAQEIQEMARETFFDIKDITEAFEIEWILHDLHQGDLFVTQYFSLLTRYWQ